MRSDEVLGLGGWVGFWGTLSRGVKCAGGWVEGLRWRGDGGFGVR